MPLVKSSPCKVNLLLNVLGRRADGFHELETIMLPLPLYDELRFEHASGEVRLTCNHPDLPTDRTNLIIRAVESFFAAIGRRHGVSIHLEKRVPLAAGLGGGSANAAITLRALNEMFDQPLDETHLARLAAELGFDVPFFLQEQPALATGRGERIEAFGPLVALNGRWILLVHPGFGVSTVWAYRELVHYPDLLNGQPGRAVAMISALREGDFASVCAQLYNALEGPVLRKYPLLSVFQDFLRQNDAPGCRMSGSGSTTFALAADEAQACELQARFRQHFGDCFWTTALPL
jgi:4-diphosphocytidyl-2-C-methyl-D-erythritol kinase